MFTSVYLVFLIIIIDFLYYLWNYSAAAATASKRIAELDDEDYTPVKKKTPTRKYTTKKQIHTPQIKVQKKIIIFILF